MPSSTFDLWRGVPISDHSASICALVLSTHRRRSQAELQPRRRTSPLRQPDARPPDPLRSGGGLAERLQVPPPCARVDLHHRAWNFGQRVRDRSIGGGPFMAADDADLDQHVARVVDSLAERFTRHDPQVVEGRGPRSCRTRSRAASPSACPSWNPDALPTSSQAAVGRAGRRRRPEEDSGAVETQATWSPTLG